MADIKEITDTKIELEIDLKPKVHKVLNTVKNGLLESIVNDQVFNVSMYNIDMFNTMLAHGKKVQEVFSGIERILDLNNVNIDELNKILNNSTTQNAYRLTNITNSTTQKNIQEALAFSQQEIEKEAKIRAAQDYLDGKFAQREEGISLTSTQTYAEDTRQIIRSNDSKLKSWHSIIDNRTRRGKFDHVKPNGQLRHIHEPFSVSGEYLRFPSDTSLGASLGNIINCRCSVMYKI